MTSPDLPGAWIARPLRSTGVQDALDCWANDAINRLRWSPYTVTQCRKFIRELAAVAGTEDLAAITPDHALEWLRRQPSPQTARTRRSIAGAVFRFLIMHGLIGVNPLASVTMPRATPGKGADVLTADEVRRVIEVARADDRDGRSSGPERARFYAFLWATALRIGEAKAQLWDDIDWRTGQMRVTKSKARREEILVLPEHLLAQMKTWPRRGLCLKVLETIPSHQAVRRDFERAGISGRGIYHRFRKGAITHMAASGTPIHVLAQFSRHTNINTLYRSYVAPQATELRDALRSLAIWTTGPMESAKKSG